MNEITEKTKYISGEKFLMCRTIVISPILILTTFVIAHPKQVFIFVNLYFIEKEICIINCSIVSMHPYNNMFES